MRKYMAFFIVLIPFLAFGQKTLDGNFCVVAKGALFASDCFELNPDGSFNYTLSSCTGNSFGNGSYTINKRKLILDFETPNIPEKKKGYYLFKPIDYVKMGEQSYEFNIVDVDKNHPIIGANIVFYDKDRNVIKGVATDMQGLASISIPNDSAPASIELSYTGYASQQIKLPDHIGKKVKVFMNNNFEENYIEAGTQKVFKIKRIKDDRFQLKKGNGKYAQYAKRPAKKLDPISTQFKKQISKDWVLTNGWFNTDELVFEKKDIETHGQGLYKVFNFNTDNTIKYALHNPQEWGLCGVGMLYLGESRWEKKGNSLVIHAKGSFWGDSNFEYVIEYDIAQVTDTELRLVNKKIIQSTTGPYTY